MSAAVRHLAPSSIVGAFQVCAGSVMACRNACKHWVFWRSVRSCAFSEIQAVPRFCYHCVTTVTVIDGYGRLLIETSNADGAAGLPPAEEFVVLVYEFAHELLHRAADSPSSRDGRELEAEAVAFVVGEAAGLQLARIARSGSDARQELAVRLRDILSRDSATWTAGDTVSRASWSDYP
jgi:hypothetical protein